MTSAVQNTKSNFKDMYCIYTWWRVEGGVEGSREDGGGRGGREWGREEAEGEGVREAHFLVIIILSASIPNFRGSFVLISELVDS